MKLFTKINRSKLFSIRLIANYHGINFYLYEGLIGLISKLILYKYFNYHLEDYFVNASPEKVLVECHNDYTRRGYKVSIVGGGMGITAIYASSVVSSCGKVDVYEGGLESVDRINENIHLNNLLNVNVHHSIVGEEVDVYGGSKSNVQTKSILDIINVDILELDCEGSEYSILKELNYYDLENEYNLPKYLFVEFHPVNNIDYNNFFNNEFTKYDIVKCINMQSDIITLAEVINNLRNGKVSFIVYGKKNSTF